MHMTLIRNATLTLHYGGVQFLIDPFLADKGTYPPFPNSENQHLKNPLVSLPSQINMKDVLNPDVVLLTHLHLDHFDDTAKKQLDHSIPVFTQSDHDAKAVIEAGFNHVTAIHEVVEIQGVRIHRTSGQHGTGEIAKQMGQVSGLVFSHPDEPVLYLAGDTIWCDDPKMAIHQYKPDVIVVNSGSAQFLQGDPITMTKEDVLAVHHARKQAKIVACHMEAVNHCLLTRDELKKYIREHHVEDQIYVPHDGDTLSF
ncbi:MBL fold metallo-hydrolase [Bacillus sp. NPDC077027]|uniref:MBL fold metallo-hydrolase n=1 Tax=Bacillus sp. NPDC077027 TaxID=3390548 RepID=UPI003CFF8B74